VLGTEPVWSVQVVGSTAYVPLLKHVAVVDLESGQVTGELAYPIPQFLVGDSAGIGD